MAAEATTLEPGRWKVLRAEAHIPGDFLFLCLIVLGQNQERQQPAFIQRVANALASAAEAAPRLSSPMSGRFAPALSHAGCDLCGQLKLLLAKALFNSHLD